MGRFLIDVPAGSTLSGGNYKYDFIRIEPVKAMTKEEFGAEVDGFESKLRSAVNEKTEQSMLLKSVQPENRTRIFAAWSANFSIYQISIFGYRWINGSRFLFQKEVAGDKQEQGILRMQEALSRLSSPADTDISADPGYCFAGGFIANPHWRNEETSLDIDIAGHPDVFLSVWIYPLASSKHDRPLLERMGGMVQFLGNLVTSVRVLRKGDRQVGPYPGQEHLASAPGSNGMRGHAFVWETQGDGTLDTPAIKIELTTGYRDGKGNQQKTSLTDKEAMKLWDDVLGSFRLRPVRDPAPTAQ
ncbi:T6SS immunity protein Tli4 family protein [Massilia luteola]|uniref:T6SS immunity protein Tli4 family protein n=1 Tax=Massilia luteola TaxID=3081751 RepID=UPI002ACC05A8|nr:T6SS immunity protein Tli4 family protein [Massilia sp. Gc5]